MKIKTHTIKTHTTKTHTTKNESPIITHISNPQQHIQVDQKRIVLAVNAANVCAFVLNVVWFYKDAVNLLPCALDVADTNYFLYFSYITNEFIFQFVLP